MKNNIYVPIVLVILLLSFTGCKKTDPPSPPPVTYTITTKISGSGTVTPDNVTGITLGSSVNLKFSPSIGNSLYSVKINGVKVESIQSSENEVSYTITDIKSNLSVEVEFVETRILLLSKLEPAWMLTKMDAYIAENNFFLAPITLTQEEKSRKYYHYYPSMEIIVLNPDGSIFWQEKWSLIGNMYKQGDQYLTVIELSQNRLIYKAKPVWSVYDEFYVYAIYTFERKK